MITGGKQWKGTWTEKYGWTGQVSKLTWEGRSRMGGLGVGNPSLQWEEVGGAGRQ